MIYLYKKTHKVTGLKYLGKTTKDPFSYMGSGVYWKRHLQKHGDEHDTEILFETTNKEDLKQKGLYYTNLWNVVESDEWANLKPETGDGGSSIMASESKEKIRHYQKNNKVWTKKALENRINNCLKAAEARKGISWSDERRKAGNIVSEEKMIVANKKRSDTLKGRVLSKGRMGHIYPDKDKITCEHCSKKLVPGYYYKYHGSNCKRKEN